jgi:hypothetical protein
MAGVLTVALTGPPAAPQVKCAVEDPRLAELSGLAVAGSALWAMSDGGTRVELHQIDPATCAVIDSRSAGVNPFDPEDLAVGPDESLWVADIGDNELRRDTVAVVVLPPQGESRLHRLAYPDGPHDAEALLVDARGRPVVITKEVGRSAGVYRTAQAPEGVGPTPLVRVGELTLPSSDTRGGPVGEIGSRVVTGAAVSVDGSVVALRTYTDAWLYPVSRGDFVGALTGTPVRVPLPDEPQGEALAFDRDGTLLSGSESRGDTGELRAVPGAEELAAARPQSDAASAPVSTPEVHEPTPAWLPAALGAGAVAGVLLMLAGAIALRRR